MRPGTAAAVTVPTRVIVVVLPAFSEFNVHERALGAQVNVGEVADTGVTPVGQVLLKVKGCDGCVPMLLMVTV